MQKDWKGVGFRGKSRIGQGSKDANHMAMDLDSGVISIDATFKGHLKGRRRLN
jgi:hypothetical protein